MTARGFAWQHTAKGLLLGSVEIAAVTAVIWALREVIPVYVLTDLYVLAMLPIAIGWGFGWALAFAVVSTVAFDMIVTPPLFAFTITHADTTTMLLISCVTAYVVSYLSKRAQQRTREAESLAREVRQFAEEQAGLRRVAELVARGAGPDEVFAAVTEEVARQLPADHANLWRYDPAGTATIVAAASDPTIVGTRARLGGRNIATLVLETAQPARIDDYTNASGAPADIGQEWGFRAAVGAPIGVEGRLWGVMIGGSTQEKPLPADAEARLARFTELVATAIANAEAQAALSASRARIVATADQTRRRLERDLHDGTQQRLVSLTLSLRAARAAAPPEADELKSQLDDVATELTGVLDELREFARGIHPAILAEGGLRSALKALTRRSAVPVELDVRADCRLPEQIEVAAYFVVSEALTNATKHAHAAVVHVEVDTVKRDNGDGVLRVCVRDEGRGGADFAHGSGLLGLKDRVEALGGRIRLQSAPGAGTTVEVELPLRGS